MFQCLAPFKQRIEWPQHNAKTLGSDGEAMAAHSCVVPVAWEDTAHMGVLIAEGQAANLAVACGTWAPLLGELAAEGLTARMSPRTAPLAEPICKLAPGLERSQPRDLPGYDRRLISHSRMFSGAGH